MGAEVLQFVWNGKFPAELGNLQNTNLQNEWVLF
jgi:hypothetical protein